MQTWCHATPARSPLPMEPGSKTTLVSGKKEGIHHGDTEARRHGEGEGAEEEKIGSGRGERERESLGGRFTPRYTCSVCSRACADSGRGPRPSSSCRRRTPPGWRG